MTIEQAIEQAMAAPGLRGWCEAVGAILTDDGAALRTEIRAALANVATAAAQLERERIVRAVHAEGHGPDVITLMDRIEAGEL